MYLPQVLTLLSFSEVLITALHFLSCFENSFLLFVRTEEMEPVAIRNSKLSMPHILLMVICTFYECLKYSHSHVPYGKVLVNNGSHSQLWA